MHGVCINTGYLAHGNSKGEARERGRHKSNSKKVVRNLEVKKRGNEGEKSQTRPD